MRQFLMLVCVCSISSDVFAHNGRRGHRHRHNRVHKPVAPVNANVIVFAGSRPWSPQYVPPQRAGYVWVPGHYMGRRWIPGHWRSSASPPRTGAIYAPGHWVEDGYVEGYWRDESRSSHQWSDGQYQEDGTWVEGGWVLIDPDGTEVIIMDHQNEAAMPSSIEEFEDQSEEQEIQIIFVDEPEKDDSD